MCKDIFLFLEKQVLDKLFFPGKMQQDKIFNEKKVIFLGVSSIYIYN